MSKRTTLHVALLLAIAYGAGSPALAAIRPEIVDPPLRGFHEEVGRALAAARVQAIAMTSDMRTFLGRLPGL